MLPLVLSITAVVLTAITAGFSIMAYAKVVGMEKSTHKIEYRSVPDGPTGKALADKFRKIHQEL